MLNERRCLCVKCRVDKKECRKSVSSKQYIQHECCRRPPRSFHRKWARIDATTAASCFLHQRPSTRRHKGALGGDGNGQTQICTYHSMASNEILVCSPELDSDRLCSAWLSWTQFCSARLSLDFYLRFCHRVISSQHSRYINAGTEYSIAQQMKE